MGLSNQEIRDRLWPVRRVRTLVQEVDNDVMDGAGHLGVGTVKANREPSRDYLQRDSAVEQGQVEQSDSEGAC